MVPSLSRTKHLVAVVALELYKTLGGCLEQNNQQQLLLLELVFLVRPQVDYFKINQLIHKVVVCLYKHHLFKDQ